MPPIERAGTLHLHADCRPVRGARNGAIYDLTRRRIVSVPVAYLDVLAAVEGRYTREDLARDAVGSDRSRGIAAFVSHLLQEELADFVDAPERFPPVAEGWRAPCEVQNAIVDVAELRHDFTRIIAQLDQLGCMYLQIRCYTDLLSLEDLEAIGRAAANTSLRSLELLLPYGERYPQTALEALLRTHLLYASVALHSAPEDGAWEVAFGDRAGEGISETRRIHLFRTRLTSSDDCGVIVEGTVLPPSLPQFMELRSFNGCLNGKIAVDVKGRIRNCPSFGGDFGSVEAVPLADVVRDPRFRAVWSIAKDSIEECRDCELRFACTDCRAFVAQPGDLYSKPAKCGYDPYSGKWDLRVSAAEAEARTPGYVRERMQTG